MKKITIKNCCVKLDNRITSHRITQILERFGIPLGYRKIYSVERTYEYLFYSHEYGGMHFKSNISGGGATNVVDFKQFFLLWYKEHGGTNHRLPELPNRWLTVYE